MRILFFLFLSFILLLTACNAQETPVPTPPAPTGDPYFVAQGVGDPRPPGYWLLWNSCAPDNRAEVAAANGGREAGWFLMDDLLDDPGILLGELELIRCQDGIRLLEGLPIMGMVDSEDTAYPLAAQLLAAQLNLAIGAEYCPAVEDAVRSAQILLVSAGFNGSGTVLGSDSQVEDRDLAFLLTQQLAEYNAGALCR